MKIGEKEAERRRQREVAAGYVSRASTVAKPAKEVVPNQDAESSTPRGQHKATPPATVREPGAVLDDGWAVVAVGPSVVRTSDMVYLGEYMDIRRALKLLEKRRKEQREYQARQRKILKQAKERP